MDPNKIVNKKYTPNSEQWKSEGKCNVCRRQSYCGKDCKAFKKRLEYETSRALMRKLFAQ